MRRLEFTTAFFFVSAVLCLQFSRANSEEDIDSENDPLPCQFASLQCSYRTGCGLTLKSYLIECGDLIANKTQECSEGCKNTLVGLTSTEEGKRLMQCRCEDDSCVRTKSRVEVCRPSVLRATSASGGGDRGPSCSEARWICMSDAECGKALEYYHLYCRSMFRGRSCTPRCKNSIGILRRQRKARRLEECTCGPGEFLFDSADSSSGLVLERRFGCAQVKENMEKLCKEEEEEKEEEDQVLDDSNKVEEEVVGSGSSKRTGGVMMVFSVPAAAAAALAVIFS